MSIASLPADCAKQWDILLLLLSSEEKKIDRIGDNEVDTVTYFYNNEGVKKILLQWLHQMNASYAKKMSEKDTALKCNEISLFWRQKGNDKYHANLIEDSYKYYCNSVMYAKQNDTEYALALANRSASLLRLKRFQECLADINLSLKNGYKVELQHKLLLRRADCYIELKKQSDAEASITAAIQHAQLLKLSATHMAEFERHVKILERKLVCMEQVLIPKDPVEIPVCYRRTNPLFTCASNTIELRCNDSVGRHVIAKQDLKRGDIVFSEKPYAWVTLPSNDYVCEMCCEANINPLPCSRCSRSVYCSEDCCSQAFNIFHKWECIGAQSDIFATIGIAHLALRVLLITASNGFPVISNMIPKPASVLDLFNSYSQVDNIQIYQIDQPDFYRMFNLVTNFDKMNNADYIQYSLTATMLTLYLEHFTTFFDELSSKVPYTLSTGQLRLFAAAVILRSIGQLICNGHATLSLSTVEDDCGRTVTEKEVRRATAIYPSAAMMNHSCDPNILNAFYKNCLVIRCSREIKSGSEVYNCYGPHRSRDTTAQRRAQLRAQYMFNCVCTACTDNRKFDFVTIFHAYACQSCRGPVTWQAKNARCQQCNAEFQPQKALLILDRAEELATQAAQASSNEVRRERLIASYRMKQQVWHRHNASLRADADKIARLYTENSEFGKSVEIIKQNIQSLEYQFGSFSVEVAHELRKLSDVMLGRIIHNPQHTDYRDWCLETHKIVKKAIQLMVLNYGGWEPLVERLKEQEILVANLLAGTRTNDDSDYIHHNFHYNLKI